LAIEKRENKYKYVLEGQQKLDEIHMRECTFKPEIINYKFGSKDSDR